jgi:hypothetical protein
LTVTWSKKASVAVMAARELHGAQVVVVVVERTRATWQAQAATADQAQ